MAVSCASPLREGPRSVELASNDANGPVTRAESDGAQPALSPDATTNAGAAMSAGKRRRNSVMALGAVRDVPTMLAGLNLRRRRCLDRRGEEVRRVRLDPRRLLGRRDRSGRRRRRGRCGGGRGLGSLLLLLGTSCGDHAHRRDRAQPGNDSRADEANDFVSSLLVLIYVPAPTIGRNYRPSCHGQRIRASPLAKLTIMKGSGRMRTLTDGAKGPDTGGQTLPRRTKNPRVAGSPEVAQGAIPRFPEGPTKRMDLA